MLDFQGDAVKRPELEEGECVVWVGHADGAVEGEVAERVDQGEAFLVGVRSLKRVYDELERGVFVFGP